MIKKLFLITFIAALPIVASANDDSNTGSQPGDLRQSLNSDTSQKIKQKREEKETEAKSKAETKKEDIRKKRCEKAGEVLAKKTALVGEKQTNIDQKLNTVEQRWQRIIDRADTKNVDATKLVVALAQFKQYHATFNADMTTLRELQSSKNKACGEESEATALKSEIRAAHTKVLQDFKQLRTFRQQTQNDVIVPILKEMASKSEGTDQ